MQKSTKQIDRDQSYLQKIFLLEEANRKSPERTLEKAAEQTEQKVVHYIDFLYIERRDKDLLKIRALTLLYSCNRLGKVQMCSS